LESVSTGDVGHTGEWLAEDVIRVIETHSHIHFAGAVTDNASANRKSWEILSAKYPMKFFYGKAVYFFCTHSV
jgi:hypothetical protein